MRRHNSNEPLDSARQALRDALRALDDLRAERLPRMPALRAAQRECSAAERELEAAMVAVESETEPGAIERAKR